MQGFLVALILDVLERLIVKGSKAYFHYMELRAELEANIKKAKSYMDVVDKVGASRDERKKAEDDLLR
jgi:hypothetical protein